MAVPERLPIQRGGSGRVEKTETMKIAVCLAVRGKKPIVDLERINWSESGVSTRNPNPATPLDAIRKHAGGRKLHG
jgi:hypothetical protein